MKAFKATQLNEAIVYAKEGGQALYLFRFIPPWWDARKRFRDAVARGEDIARIYDTHLGRLDRTARRLGENPLIHKKMTAEQHIAICGEPLRRVLSECGPVQN